MIRLMGAVLAAAGCGWLGLRGAGALREQARGTWGMAAGLALLEGELELNAPPLPRLLERCARRAEEPAKGFLTRCARGMDRLGEVPFSAVWRQEVEECGGLSRACRETLLPLGDLLGRRESRVQAEGVAQVRRRLEELAGREQEESRRQGRVLQALGLSGGAFLVILLL